MDDLTLMGWGKPKPKKSIEQILKEMGYQDPKKLIASRSEEDKAYLWEIVSRFPKERQANLIAQIRALSDETAAEKVDISELEQAIKKWQEYYNGTDQASWIYIPTTFWSEAPGKILRSITVYGERKT